MKTKSMLSFAFGIFLSTLAIAAQPSTLDQGIELFEAGDYDGALVQFERASGSSVEGEQATFYIGRVYYEKREFKAASKWFEKSIEMEPTNGDYHSWLAQSYSGWALQANMFRKMSLADDIRRSYQNAVKFSPDDIEKRKALMKFYLGAPGMAGGSIEKAQDEAEAIARLDVVEGQYALGRIHEKKKEYDKAEQAYREVIELSPDSPGPYYHLAVLHQRQEKFDEAYRVLSSLQQAHPEEILVHYHIGRNGALSGVELEASMASLELYIDGYREDPTIPSLAFAHTRRGQIYVRQGMGDMAREAFTAALRLEPGHREAKKELKALD